jgi:hypothetical protein
MDGAGGPGRQALMRLVAVAIFLHRNRKSKKRRNSIVE